MKSETPRTKGNVLRRESEAGESLLLVRVLVWLYFALLILEGPLRKWILPDLSNPLLLVRDPVAILLYLACLATGAFRLNGIIAILGILGILSFITGMTVGTQNFLVTLYGFDACFFHLPLIYVIGRSFRKSDVLVLGRVVMLLAIPMAGLMVVQFRSEPTAYVNAGPGGSRGSQMEAVMGKIRPPGYFNFITGAAQFLSMTTAFVVYGLLAKERRKVLVYAGVLAIVISAAVSTSRLTLGGIGLVLLCIGVIAVYNRSVVRGVVGMLLPVGLVFFIATTLDVFREGANVMEARLVHTGEANTNVVRTASNWSERVLGDFIAGFQAMETAPTLGYGLGYGTNVGSRVLTGRMVFLGDEREWGRVIFELGPILGTIYLGVRVWMVVGLFLRSATSAREGNFLPMLLFGSCGLLLVNGQLGVASTLGFAVMGAGLCLAASNTVAESVEVVNALPVAKRRRGTSLYAEKWIRSPRKDE